WMSSSSKPAAYSPYTTDTTVNTGGPKKQYWEATVSDRHFPECGNFEMKAYGYTTANSGGNGRCQQRTAQRYSGGLGNWDGGTSRDCADPQHSIDNDGTNDFILIVFGAGHEYAPTLFSIGWEYYNNCSTSTVSNTCPDIEAWVGNDFNAA